MAEYTIDTDAGVFGIDKFTPYSWICRDDDDNYWTVFRNTSGNLEVYKSTDSGVNWILKKTITNADFSNGNPLPTSRFQLIQLTGQEKIYLFISEQTSPWDDYLYLYGWIFDTNADTNSKDLDKANIDSGYVPHVYWDDYNDRLLVYCQRYNAEGEGRFGKINLDTTVTYNSYNIGCGKPLSYFISVEGYGYPLGESLTNGRMILKKMKNNADYNNSLDSITIAITKANLKFANVVCDSTANPIVGYAYNDGGTTPKLIFTKKDKTDLSTELDSDSHTLSSAVMPESCFIVVDGNDNIYFIFTDGSDKEAYFIKYDGTSWGSETKISSDFDGKLVMPEVQSPITDNEILLTYQATE